MRVGILVQLRNETPAEDGVEGVFYVQAEYVAIRNNSL
jgi:hypothetical protein